jgi:hypothetical protein
MGWFRLAIAAGLLQQADQVGFFLNRIFQMDPAFFLKQSSPVFWSMATILFKTQGKHNLLRRAETWAAAAPGWPYRRAFLQRTSETEKSTKWPPFKWPAQISNDSGGVHG